MSDFNVEQDEENRLHNFADLSSIKVIVPLGVVPSGATVHMVGGSNHYSVQRQIKIYRADKEPPTVINSGEGSSFLLGPAASSINTALDTMPVIWVTTTIALLERIEDARMAVDSK